MVRTVLYILLKKHGIKEMVAYINNGLPYIVMHVSFTSIGRQVVDQLLEVRLILFIVNISLGNVFTYLPL